MLDTLFMSVLDMTKAGSIVILAVLLVRLLLRRVPKAVSYGLWLVVLIRLLCPVGLVSPVSVMPEITPVEQNYALEDVPVSFAGAGVAAYQAVGDMVNGGIGMQHVPTQRVDDQGNVEYVITDMGDVWILFGSYLWALGVSVMAAYSAVSLVKLKRKLREAVRLEKGVYLSERIESPFVMGLLRPRIYLPQGLEDWERGYILAHERQHIRRIDPVWKALGFLALSIHWFNPLVWMAFVLACRDMEMSCDEAVLKRLGAEIRGDYAASLLKITTGKRIIAGSPLAFGEGDPKSRIRNLAKWKKPVLWITTVAVVLCAVLAACLLTDPPGKTAAGYNGNTYLFGQITDIQEDTLVLVTEDGRDLKLLMGQDFVLPGETKVGDQVMLRATWQEQRQSYTLTRISDAETVTADTLEEAVEQAILRMGSEPENKNQFACASFARVSGKGAENLKEGTVTVYGLALHQVYAARNGKLQEISGSHIPVAMIFRVTAEGAFRLVEYWMPRDGSYYPQDIRDRFPLGIIPDTQDYILFQRSECEEKAQAHFGISQPTESESTVPPTTEKVYGFDISKVPEDGRPSFEELPEDYGREDAIRDGVAVMENESAYANADVWEAFVKNVEDGIPAGVRVMNCVMGVRTRMEDILFDGESFLVLSPMYYIDGRYSETFSHYYNHLAVFTGELKDGEGRVYERYTRYGLCVWEPAGREPGWDIWHTGGDIIVFQYRTEYKTYQLPETLVSAKLMLEDLVMGTVTDPQKLESLRNMLANAEYDPEVNTAFAMEELYLDLTFSDGTQLQLTMFPELDRILSDGIAYDYGPWDKIKIDEGQEYRVDYNALLDLVRHFGLEDWPKEFSQWCIDHHIEPPRHSLKVLVGEAPHEH